MRSLPKIERWEAEYVYTHMRVANRLFWSTHCDQMQQAAFWAEVAPIMVEVHRYLCASSVPQDYFPCHFGKERSRPCDFCEP
jgi:hypothetical protein